MKPFLVVEFRAKYLKHAASPAREERTNDGLLVAHRLHDGTPVTYPDKGRIVFFRGEPSGTCPYTLEWRVVDSLGDPTWSPSVGFDSMVFPFESIAARVIARMATGEHDRRSSPDLDRVDIGTIELLVG